MKKILIASLIVILVFGLVGCTAVQTKLDTPINVRVEDGILKWSSVDGATEYLIMINLEEKSVKGDISFDLRNMPNIEVGEEYTIKVKAKSSDPFKTSSDFSDPITWVATISSGANNNNNGYVPPENLEDVNDNSTINKLYETGLGLGVDALSAESIVGEARKASIFNDDAFDETTIGSYKVGSTRANATSESNIISMISTYNSKIVLGSKADASYGGMFTAGFESKFSIGESIDESQKKNQFYYTINHYYTGKNYQIKNFTEAERFESKLSESFISAVEKLESGAMTAETFFFRYGTHIVMAVSYGGMLEISNSMLSTETIKTTELSAALSANLEASISYGLGDASAGNNINLDMNNMDAYTEGKYTSHLNIKSIGGGTNLKVSSFSALSVGYADWVESLSDEDNHCITDVADGGLVPVWYYIPAEYSEAIELLKNYFAQQAGSISDTLAAKMRYEDLGDITNFAGGYGTKESPYLIQTVEQLKNVNKYLDGHFKLMNDLNLGNNWTPIGQYSWNRDDAVTSAFCGTFDGNNKTITYSISKNAFESNSICYAYGLFGSATNATIKNVKAVVDISMDSVGNKKSAMNYVGGIVGRVSNSTISNCSVSGRIYCNSTTEDWGGVNAYSGAQRAGGIAGYAVGTIFKGNSNSATVHSEGYQVFAGGICGGIDSWDGSTGNNGKANNQSIYATKGGWVYGYAIAAATGPLLTQRGTYTKDY